MFIFAQDGDELNTAILCVDNNPVLASDVATSTASTIGAPNCGSETDDAFYFNTISTGDNKIILSMETSVAVVTTVNYQILRAPNGDTNNLEEVFCGSYNVIAGAPPITPPGGSFSYEITSNINDGDEFYLRVYKPSGLTGTALQTLFNNTTIEMTSEFDGTLAIDENNYSKFSLLVRESELKIMNNNTYKFFQIYNLTGKLITSDEHDEPLSQINISLIKQGLYVLVLSNGVSQNALKFVKR
ncbi:T9SS type A sorting domain-containing protein [Geojedonia litorea]|uniref:T9SS type A sorting domain-containing protein n=2 Tax=Geojedonia litorea TaxID=1268269 RepID=A0ABV9N0P2_9FLAO